MERDASKITNWFADKEGEFKELWTRMDEDLEVWEMNPSPANMTAYESSVKAKTREHIRDINIISNELRVNCDNVLSILSSADMQIQVKMAEAEGIDKRAEIGKLERLFYFMLEQGDLRLRRLLLPSLRESSNWHALVRGWRAARILNYKSKGSIIVDYMPLDPRYLVYEMGESGVVRVAYKGFKSKSSLESEWGKELAGTPWYKPWVKEKKSIEVIDYWEYEDEGRIGNAVVCQNTFLKEPEILKMRSMPFSIIPVSTRPPIADSSGTRLKGYGESIFASGRAIHAVRNRFASVVANYTNLLANQPMINYRTAMGRSIPSDAMFNVPGGVVELTMGENRLEPPPMREISPTVVNMLAWLSGQVEATLLPKFGVEQPPASGTRFALGMEQSNKVFNPQLRSLNHFYEDICRLIEEQLIDGGIKVKVQSLLKKEYAEGEVTPVDLKKPHRIMVETTARNPWEQMDTAQIAQMLESLGLPKIWIWENILKIQDPKLMQDLMALEIYEHSPEGMMKRAVEVLMDRGYVVEAQKLVEQMVMMERQQQAMVGKGARPPEGPPEMPPEMPPGPPVMPPEAEMGM